MKPDNEPHAKRRGILKNDNESGDFFKAPRCGAKTRNGGACKGPGMANGRCRLHGGLSTGPLTQEGLARSQKANWKHGLYSAKNKEIRGMISRLCRESKGLLEEIG